MAAAAGAFGMLATEHGVWSPLLWTVVMAVALVVAWGIRRAGRKDAPGGKEAGTPFVSANPVENLEEARVGASHLYWGFTEALKGYYAKMRAFHSGILTDYLAWFAAVLGLAFALSGLR
jgi:hypothetical protein